MKWMISCHDGKHRNDFPTVGKHLDTHCSRCAKTCRKFLQYQSIHQREKPSNNGKEGELLRPLLVAFWRIENTQFPAVLIPCCETHEKFWDSPNLDSECLIRFSRRGRMTFTVIYYAFLVLRKSDSGVAQNAVRKGALSTTFTPLTSALAVKVGLSPTFPGHFLPGESFWESPNLLSGQTLRKALR